ncbi:MAG TPA: GIY-YIG nuclease family protein [Bacteroidia bacterium]|nr:GIY-YIG nuclease family protein [Bacteroidia bacterium]
MYYVYVLYSEEVGKYYIGQTNNIERRIQEHNLRQHRYTSNKGLWKLIYKEEHATRSMAMKRESFFKSGKGREFIKSNLSKLAE